MKEEFRIKHKESRHVCVITT